jgi:hypothetical protein
MTSQNERALFSCSALEEIADGNRQEKELVVVPAAPTACVPRETTAKERRA